MEKFAVIDTETNWYDKVMSIGAVIADSRTFDALDYKYYVLEPEYRVGGMFSYALFLNLDVPYDTIKCNRESAIADLTDCLNAHNVTKIFAYNAAFDYRHLPELNTFAWYDIMRLAAYRQFNSKIREEDCCSTGRLKRDFGVEKMKYLLTGLRGETHNALSDAIDELTYVMKPLGRTLDEYILYYPKTSTPA